MTLETTTPRAGRVVDSGGLTMNDQQQKEKCSGVRDQEIRGRRNIQNQRASQPSTERFAVRRIIGSGDLWITEFVLTYDGKHETLVKATVPFPRLMTYFVSGVEFVGGSFIWLICSGPGKFSADYWLAARLLR
jgi:hypothetical protein